MTALKPETCIPIEAEGALRLDTPTGRTVDVRADGNVFHVNIPGWPELRAMMPGSMRTRSHTLRVLSRAANMSELRLSLECAGRPFLELGHGTSPSLLARLLGLAPARLNFSVFRLFLAR